MRLPLEEIRTRRFEPSPHGQRLDLRRILRETGSKGSDHLLPHYRRPRWRRPPVVVLCDISGSMDAYARVLLHFLYALTNDRDRVHTFLFGTRLTNITRTLKSRDPDVAIAKAAKDVVDWSGGTRIGACLDEFNRRWARRVLGQNALVLLFTDGLDREGAEGLDIAARRLSASCRRLVWLNPLMRYEAYAPLAAGAKALSAHVHEMRSCHNLQSLEDLAESLGPRGSRADGRQVASAASNCAHEIGLRFQGLVDSLAGLPLYISMRRSRALSHAVVLGGPYPGMRKTVDQVGLGRSDPGRRAHRRNRPRARAEHAARRDALRPEDRRSRSGPPPTSPATTAT